MSNSSTLQAALDYVEALSQADQDLLIALIQKRRVENRRAEIAQNAVQTLAAVQLGTAKFGTLAELKADLLSEVY